MGFFKFMAPALLFFFLTPPSYAKNPQNKTQPIIPLPRHSLSLPKTTTTDVFIPKKTSGIPEKKLKKLRQRLKTIIVSQDSSYNTSQLFSIKKDSIDLLLSYRTLKDDTFFDTAARALYFATTNLEPKLKGRESIRNLKLRLLAQVVLNKDTTKTMQLLAQKKHLLSKSGQNAYNLIYGYKLLASKFTLQKGKKILLSLANKQNPSLKLAAYTYLAIGLSRAERNYHAALFKRAIFLSFSHSKWATKEVVASAANHFLGHAKISQIKQIPMPALRINTPRIYSALLERYSIAQNAPDRKLISLYENARKKGFDPLLESKIDLRLLSLYERSRAKDFYFKKLGEFAAKYQKKPNALKMSEHHRKKTFTEIEKNIEKYTTIALESAAKDKRAIFHAHDMVRMALKFVRSEKKRIMLSESLATLQEDHRLYKEAADTYLALSNIDPRKSAYLLKAFENQARAANWNEKDPWPIKKGPIKERKSLLAIAEKITKKRPQDYRYLNHRALLYASLGKNLLATNSLILNVSKTPKGVRTHKILSVANHFASRLDQQDLLIKIAKKAQKMGHNAPMFGSDDTFRVIMKKAYLKKAVLACSAKNYKKGFASFDTYLSFKDNPEKKEKKAYFKAIRCAEKGRLAYGTIKLVAKLFKKYDRVDGAARIAEIASKLAVSKKDYPAATSVLIMALAKIDDEIARHKVRLMLANVYKMDKNYTKEKEIYLAELANESLPDRLRTSVALKSIEIEKLYGSLGNIERQLAYLKGLKGVDRKLYKKIVLFEVGHAIAKKDTSKLSYLEKRLLSIKGRKDASIQYALGSVRFLRGLQQSNGLLSAFNDKAKDLESGKVLNLYKDTILAISKFMNKTCLDKNPHCAEAKFRVRLFADKMLGDLGQMDLDTETQKESEALKLYRVEVERFMNGVANREFRYAKRLAREGKATLAAKEAILYYDGK